VKTRPTALLFGWTDSRLRAVRGSAPPPPIGRLSAGRWPCRSRRRSRHPVRSRRRAGRRRCLPAAVPLPCGSLECLTSELRRRSLSREPETTEQREAGRVRDISRNIRKSRPLRRHRGTSRTDIAGRFDPALFGHGRCGWPSPSPLNPAASNIPRRSHAHPHAPPGPPARRARRGSAKRKPRRAR